MDKRTEAQLAGLNDKLEKLLAEFGQYPEAQLRRKPAPDQWSALECLQHLMIAEGLSEQYLRKKLSYNPKLEKAGLGAQFRTTLLRAYLSLPFKFKAPPGVRTDDMDPECTFAELADQWKKQRQNLRDFMASLPDAVFSAAAYKHPFAGRLSLHGMLTFFDSHFDRHAAQARRSLDMK